MSASSVLVLDTSALLRRYLADRDRPLVINAMDQHPAWAASSMARTEIQLALHLAAPNPQAQGALWSTVRDDWESLWEIPVDGRCLARATDIGARYGIGVTDALPLAAADRLPRPVTFMTFERQQIPAAADLGFRVISPFE